MDTDSRGHPAPTLVLEAALARAHAHAIDWTRSLDERPVPPRAGVHDVIAALGPDLPDSPTSAPDVIDLLAAAAEPGLTAMPSGRFFGFVIGGTHPAALAADWLVSAWDQNCALRLVTPAHTAVEDVASAWLLDLLGLPPESAVGFVTGATMAQFTCLAAARDDVLRRLGWDVAAEGLAGAPGSGSSSARSGTTPSTSPCACSASAHLKRSRSTTRAGSAPTRLAAALDTAPAGQPRIVVLQAGNIHSGAFDPLAEAIAAAHEHGAWVHIDGAFGLWAAASPRHRASARRP